MNAEAVTIQLHYKLSIWHEEFCWWVVQKIELYVCQQEEDWRSTSDTIATSRQFKTWRKRYSSWTHREWTSNTRKRSNQAIIKMYVVARRESVFTHWICKEVRYDDDKMKNFNNENRRTFWSYDFYRRNETSSHERRNISRDFRHEVDRSHQTDTSNRWLCYHY